MKTGRDAFLVDVDLDRLKERISQYFDSEVNHEEIEERWPAAMGTSKSFPKDGRSVRESRLAHGESAGRYIPYAYGPFDVRWLYWVSETGLLARPTPDYVPHAFDDNRSLVLQTKARPDLSPPLVTSRLGDLNQMNSGNYIVPLWLRDDQFGDEVEGVRRTANLSDIAQEYIERLDASPEDLFHHVLATLHEPSYQETHADALRAEGPRIPLPTDAAEFAASAERGRLLARLLDTESNVADLLDPSIAVPTKTDGTQMQPADFEVKANWGYFNQGAVMPGQGKIERRGDMVDVYLNDRAYWKDVPIEVWEYRLGGYQVLKKWLSYRESKVLGRGLTVSEVAWWSEVARRIGAVLAIANDRLPQRAG